MHVGGVSAAEKARCAGRDGADGRKAQEAAQSLCAWPYANASWLFFLGKSPGWTTERGLRDPKPPCQKDSLVQFLSEPTRLGH